MQKEYPYVWIYSLVEFSFIYNNILPLVKKHHQLLVTLLLTNAAAMEILPVSLLFYFPFPSHLLCALFLFFFIILIINR